MTMESRVLQNSGRKQITLRIPNTVYEALKKEAEEKGVTINELILLKINPLNMDF